MTAAVYSLLCVIPVAVCVYPLRERKKRARRRAVRIMAAALFLLAAILLAWLADFYRADPAAEKALLSGDTVTVERSVNGWRFDGPGENTALVFYPGAKVEAAAYAPLLFRIAEGGTDAFLVEMPFHIALFNSNAADRLIGAYPYTDWILAGHSLGGVAAAGYANAHTDRVSGLVLLASYPAAKLDERLAFLSVYGDRDGVLNRESFVKSRAYWPADAEEQVIPGGNHAQFGAYGAQRGDGEAAISREEQLSITAEAIQEWISQKKAAEK